ncbi:hypothetical protein GDO78_017781 [Eleutherodactylus coqui]|uniref:Telomeric repeat-binding factor 2-interacting protein 1 n=2 Tax=Eleutherodactylus coqui TaxID=57060 RepID=A0A8J6EKB5_ELECQ|nr:hypothetical protein GDO78_017781 [Eleutherodactylus coqui]
MKCRYTSYIKRHKHLYMLKGPDQAEAKTPNANHPGGPSSAATAQDPDPSPAETPLRSSSTQEAPHRAADPMEGACTDIPNRDEDISHPGGSLLRRVNGIIDSSSEREEGKRMHMATSKQLPVPREDPDNESEDLQIFEIANLEFEVDDDGFVCKAKVPRLTLKDFVMGEDSASGNTQLQIDDVHSSPGVSDCEGLQDAMTDLMREFKLDICQVTQALLKNNGEVGSTRHFLHTGLRPDGFPIWEHQDDVDLQSDDPSVQAQLAKKYSADNVAKRTAFLAS